MRSLHHNSAPIYIKKQKENCRQFSFFVSKNLRQKQFCGTNHKTVGEKVENVAEIVLLVLFIINCPKIRITKSFTKIELYPFPVKK